LTIKELINAIKRHLIVIMFCLSAGVGLSIYQTSKIVPMYQGESTVFVSTPPTFGDLPGASRIGELSTGNNFSQSRVKSYASIVNNPFTVNNLIQKHKLKASVGEIAEKISAKEITGTVLIQILVIDKNPVFAANLANWVASEFANTVETLELNANTGSSQLIRVTLIKSSNPNFNPVSPRKLFNYFVGLFVGGLVACIYILIRRITGQKVKNESDLGDSHLFGVISYDEAAKDYPILTLSDTYSRRNEAYRTIRSMLIHKIEQSEVNSIVVTSCVPGEGKTTGSLNLGYSLSQAGFKVVVVETDMRRPTFKNYRDQLDISLKYSDRKDFGVAQLLNPKYGKCTSKEIKAAITPSRNENLFLLFCGNIPSNPTELLEGERMPFLNQYLNQNFDFVIYDSPPVLSVVDAVVLARIAKQVLLMIHAGVTPKSQYRSTLATLNEVSIPPMGVILNKVPKPKFGEEYGYSYSGYNYARYSYSYSSQPKKVTESANNPKTKLFKFVSNVSKVNIFKNRGTKKVTREPDILASNWDEILRNFDK